MLSSQEGLPSTRQASTLARRLSMFQPPIGRSLKQLFKPPLPVENLPRVGAPGEKTTPLLSPQRWSAEGKRKKNEEKKRPFNSPQKNTARPQKETSQRAEPGARCTPRLEDLQGLRGHRRPSDAEGFSCLGALKVSGLTLGVSGFIFNGKPKNGPIFPRPELVREEKQHTVPWLMLEGEQKF